MGIVKLSHIISYSSQDPRNPCKNLLNAYESPRPWLSSKTDFTGRLEAEIQLEKASEIHFIDIGNMGSCTIEVLVSNTSAQEKIDYVPLLPTKTLLTLNDLREEILVKSVFMFDRRGMNNMHSDKEWDRIKIILCQPYNKRSQFGLSFIQLRCNDNNEMQDVYNYEDPFADNDNIMYTPPSTSDDGTCDENLKESSTSKPIASAYPQIIRIPSAEFRNNVNNFLIACHGEDEQRGLEELANDFQQQMERELFQYEIDFFVDIYKEFQRNLAKSKPQDFIEADECQPSTSSGLSAGSFIECPMCHEYFPRDEIQKHVDEEMRIRNW